MRYGNPWNTADADPDSHVGQACLSHSECPSHLYCAFDFEGGGFCNVGCHDDSECSSGLICVNTGECASPFVAIALDATNVYYVKTGARGSIERISKDGTNAVVLAANLNWPWAIAVDGEYAYWTNTGSSSTPWLTTVDGSVMRVPLAGGDPEVLVSGLKSPSAVAVDDTSVYWLDAGIIDGSLSPKRGGTLSKAPKSGGSIVVVDNDVQPLPRTAVFIPSLPLPPIHAITVDAKSVSWLDNHGIYSIPKTGGTRTKVMVDFATGLVGYGEDVIYASPFVGVTLIHDVVGQSPLSTVIGARYGSAADIAIQSQTVFWTESGGAGLAHLLGESVDPEGSRSHRANGLLMKAMLFDGAAMPSSGGVPQQLASGLPVPVAIAVDEGNVYWAQGGYDLAPAGIMRMPVEGGDAVTIVSASSL